MSDRKVKPGLGYNKKTGKLFKGGQYSDEALDELIGSGDSSGTVISIIVLVFLLLMYFKFGKAK